MERSAAVGRRRELRREDVPTLVRSWQDQRDALAHAELVRRFAPLARGLARRYRSTNESDEDLHQVALVGLIGALDRFDPDLGVAFKAYAVPTILGELKRHFRDTGWAVHVPRRLQELSMSVEHARRQLTVELGRAPGPGEIAADLGLAPEEVAEGLRAGSAQYAFSLDAPASSADDESDDSPLVEILGHDDESLALVDAAIDIGEALRHLPHTERVALRLRTEEGLLQRDIANRMGCSQMQVSRLLHRARARVEALVHSDGSQDDASASAPMAGSR